MKMEATLCGGAYSMRSKSLRRHLVMKHNDYDLMRVSKVTTAFIISRVSVGREDLHEDFLNT